MQVWVSVPALATEYSERREVHRPGGFTLWSEETERKTINKQVQGLTDDGKSPGRKSGAGRWMGLGYSRGVVRGGLPDQMTAGRGLRD